MRIAPPSYLEAGRWDEFTRRVLYPSRQARQSGPSTDTTDWRVTANFAGLLPFRHADMDSEASTVFGSGALLWTH
jgi:hypothetical protein